MGCHSREVGRGRYSRKISFYGSCRHKVNKNPKTRSKEAKSEYENNVKIEIRAYDLLLLGVHMLEQGVNNDKNRTTYDSYSYFNDLNKM